MKGCQGQGCTRRRREAKASRGRWGVAGCGRGRVRASPPRKMHVLGHPAGRRTEGAGCNVENAHREGAQNRRFAKCQGQTGRGGGRRLAEDQEQREEPTSPSKGLFG
uniref:Uncharacterized protein n=1 Tax=Mus musculus TaxID=10090 RepID=Q3UUJ1_MOUSE|nr:unnamed protein product [Mus musculus]